MAPDRSRGIFEKYEVRRADGRDAPGEKHEACPLFVLDLRHDEHARYAALAYAASARSEGYELLAADLERAVEREGGVVVRTLAPSPLAPLAELNLAPFHPAPGGPIHDEAKGETPEED